MNLLDRGIKMAAEADEPAEMNFVRKHAMEQVGAPSSMHACIYLCRYQEAPEPTRHAHTPRFIS